jgi:diguanylate cyclase (GGDEF)-like protein
VNDPGPASSIAAVAMIAAGVLVGFAVLRSRSGLHSGRHSRWLLAAALVSWGSGAGLWLAARLSEPVLVPSAADALTDEFGFIAAVLFYGAAVIVHPALKPRSVRLRALVDATIVAASVSAVLWLGAARELLQGPGELLDTVIHMGYPVSDVAMIWLSLTIAARARAAGAGEAHQQAAVLIAVAFGSFLLGDSARLLTGDTEAAADAIPLLTWACWLGGFLVIAFAAGALRWPSPLRRWTTPGEWLDGALGVGPILAAIVAGAVAAIDWALRRTVDPTGVLLLTAVISLVLARQSLTLNDNRELGVSLQRAVADLEHQANHDGLTGLPNRSGLTERIRTALGRSQGTSHRVALLFVDLDHLKPVNDSLGHAAGDALLRTTAERLASRVGPNVTRFGGDEFVVLLDDLPALDTRASAELLGRMIVDDTSRPIELHHHVIRPSVSVGVAIAEPGIDPDELVRRADVALYRAKAEGRRCVASYVEEAEADERSRMGLEFELRRALRSAEFEVHYQPVVELSTGRVEGVESLVRWRHPTRGLLGPDAFLEQAASLGLLGLIGEQTLVTACADLGPFRRPDGGAPLTVAVNLSTTELTDARIVGRVRQALHMFGMEPPRLVIEITEDVVVDETIRATIDELRTLGVHLAIDDFGTGNSSLRQLGTYPARTLKIDRSFVSRIDDDPDSLTISRTILGLARNLGLRTVAEGVETPEQARTLAALGCDSAQGWYFARAMPIDELEVFLAADAVHGWRRTDQLPSRASVAAASFTMRSSSSATVGMSTIAPTT